MKKVRCNKGEEYELSKVSMWCHSNDFIKPKVKPKKELETKQKLVKLLVRMVYELSVSGSCKTSSEIYDKAVRQIMKLIKSKEE